MIGKGKISEQDLAELKALNQGAPIFKYTWRSTGDELFYKAISTQIYHNILEMVDAFKKARNPGLPVEDVHMRIFDSCVLWPKLTLEEKYNLPIGVIPSIAKSIQEKSGLLDIDIMDRILAPDVTSSVVQPFNFWADATAEDISAVRAVWSGALFKVRVERCNFIVRPMTRSDVKASGQAVDDKITIAKLVTMWPTDVKWEDMPAGWVENLGSAAIELSGWDSEFTVEEV